MNKRNFPEIFGVGEVERFLGVSKQYVGQLVGENKLIPVAHLSCGRIFLKSDVENFKQKREGKKKN